MLPLQQSLYSSEFSKSVGDYSNHLLQIIINIQNKKYQNQSLHSTHITLKSKHQMRIASYFTYFFYIPNGLGAEEKQHQLMKPEG